MASFNEPTPKVPTGDDMVGAAFAAFWWGCALLALGGTLAGCVILARVLLSFYP